MKILEENWFSFLFIKVTRNNSLVHTVTSGQNVRLLKVQLLKWLSKEVIYEQQKYIRVFSLTCFEHIMYYRNL